VSQRRYSLAGIFRTFQGEGINSGRRACFVRFAGCNAWNGHEHGRGHGVAACAKWCDTNFLHTGFMHAEEIIARMDAAYPSDGSTRRRLCVVTGGEPMLQLTPELLAMMHAAQWEVAVETNGSIDTPVAAHVDLLTVSPKRGLTLVVPMIQRAPIAELKVVVPGIAADALGAFTPWTVEALQSLAELRRWNAMWLHPQDVPHVEPTFDVHITHLQRASAGGVQSPERIQRAYEESVRTAVEFAEQLGSRWRLGVQAHKVLGLA
jgi:7-carboxy-7-deazaguanine synthase